MSTPMTSPAATQTRLRVENINTYYGDSHVLRDVSLHIGAGETVALLGRNGVGKTTTLKSIVGWQPPRTGSVTLDGQELTGRGMMAIARMGVSLVPEERRIFTNLTVAENLRLAQVTAQKPGWTLDHVYEKFPRLRERLTHKGDEISGGEKQMLAIARAMVEPRRLLLIDEPSKGLAPAIVQNLIAALRELKRTATTVLLVEQNFQMAKALGDRVAVMDDGRVVHRGAMAELADDEGLQHRLLGLSLAAHQ